MINNIVENMTLTSCQTNAVNTFVPWINKDKELWYATLIGPAGNGKTFVAKYIAQNCNFKFNICVSAPTHKAKNTIRKSVPFADCHTIQALCGLAPNVYIEGFDINNPKFAPINKPRINQYKLVLIDEASMINKDLFELILQLAEKYKVKVLFIGDGFQVPPVNEQVSPVFENAELSYTLLTPVRQKPTNPLTLLLAALRCDIATQKGVDTTEYYAQFLKAYVTFTNKSDNVIKINNDYIGNVPIRSTLTKFLILSEPKISGIDGGYKFVRNKEIFKTEALTAFTDGHFAMDVNHVRLCTYTNDNVKEWNKEIRNAITKNPDFIQVGDILMAYTTINKSFKDALITNSQEYLVVNVEESTKDEIRGWRVRITCTDSKKVENLFIVHPDDYKTYILTHEKYHYNARTYRKWKEYYGWKKHYLVMDSLNKMFKKVQMPDGTRSISERNLPKKDVDFGFAITVHKSQGSTYRYSYVDAKDFLTLFEIAKNPYTELTIEQARLEYLNLLYVAVSRAKDTAIIYI